MSSGASHHELTRGRDGLKEREYVWKKSHADESPGSNPQILPTLVLPHHLVFDNDGAPLADNIKVHFERGWRLHVEDALNIVQRCALIMKEEPNVVRLKGSAVVCGDLHGQFHDLLTLLEVNGQPSVQQYVFLGDYVDRGDFSAEIVLLCMSFKLLYPRSFILLRGNHESRQLTSCFNFKQEIENKYSSMVYEEIMAAFDCFPLSCVVNDRFFCVHGGLSPLLTYLGEIDTVNRFRETPSTGPMCDLLWSDPMFGDDTDCATPSEEFFVFNTKRGCSYNYSYEAVCRFLEANNLCTVIRGHETQPGGYKLYRHTPKGVPAVVCVFSASNYCGTYGNMAAVVAIDGDVMNIRQYMATSHDSCTPNHFNAISRMQPLAIHEAVEKWCEASHGGSSGDAKAEEVEVEKKLSEDDSSVVLREKLGDMICAMHHIVT